MNRLEKSELKKLIGEHESPCVSIYVPTHRAGKEVEQNKIRFKNMVREAEKKLRDLRVKSAVIDDMLSEANRFVQDARFWHYQSDGLAVFICPGSFRYYRVPISFPELAVVANRLHIKPLLPLLSANRRFYLLALSMNNVRLFQGTQFTVAEMNLENAPKSLADALKYEEFEKELQFYTGAPSRGGRRDAIYHGTGDSEETIKNQILRYFQQVDRGLHQFLKEEKAPLVLAGVDYLFPIYREANKYPNLAQQHVTGNPDKLTAGELHQLAWPLVEPILKKGQNDALERFHKLTGTNSQLASSNLETIVPAAVNARVDTLMVTRGEQTWGRYADDSGTVHLDSRSTSDNVDLLDFAAFHALSNGATVYAMDRDELPDGSAALAIFRF